MGLLRRRIVGQALSLAIVFLNVGGAFAPRLIGWSRLVVRTHRAPPLWKAVALIEIGAGTSPLSFAPGDAIKSRCKGERPSSRLSEHLSVGTRAHWRRFAPTILPPTSSRPSWRDPASTPH